jgi:uncharacterized membrane protein
MGWWTVLGIALGSVFLAVGFSILIWAIRHLGKNHYTPKSTRSTYISPKHSKKSPKPLFLGLEIFLEATAGALAFIVVMGFVVGWKSEFSWIPSLMIGYVVGSLASIFLIRRERKAEQG